MAKIGTNTSKATFKLIFVRVNTLGPLCLWQCFMFEGFPFKYNVKTSRPLSVSFVLQDSHSDSHSQARLKTPPKSSEFSPIYFTRSHVGQAQDTEFNVGRQLVSWGSELASPWALGGESSLKRESA